MTSVRTIASIGVFALSSISLFAQTQQLSVRPADTTAAESAKIVALSANRALTDAGRDVSESTLKFKAANSSSKGHGNPHPSLFPADLSFNGGPVVPSARLHNLFINQPPAAWGDPLGFLNDLNHSDLIHITDQYVGSNENGRYPIGLNFGTTVAPGAAFPGKPANIITQAQIVGLVHAVASITGAGLDNVVNVFIPPGTDTCFPGNHQCFSPDNPATFAFCAYHSAVRFSDIGDVAFTVLPETGVPGCASAQPSVNGIVADSVDSTTSHEIIELITDPELDAWFVTGSLDLGGFEIGDVCQPGGNDQAQFLVPTFRVNNHLYAIQLEYSNKGHGCFSRPGGGGGD